MGIRGSGYNHRVYPPRRITKNVSDDRFPFPQHVPDDRRLPCLVEHAAFGAAIRTSRTSPDDQEGVRCAAGDWSQAIWPNVVRSLDACMGGQTPVAKVSSTLIAKRRADLR